jgi:hypothetical protein
LVAVRLVVLRQAVVRSVIRLLRAVVLLVGHLHLHLLLPLHHMHLLLLLLLLLQGVEHVVTSHAAHHSHVLRHGRCTQMLVGKHANGLFRQITLR